MVEVIKKMIPTDQDIKLVQMVADEFTAKEIAEKLRISKRTVEDRKDRLTTKWGCKSFIGVVVIFVKNNLIK